MDKKTLLQWQDTLRKWRYSVVAKARTYEEQLIINGGAEWKVDRKFWLTDLQKRAMKLFGAATVHGIKGALSEAGFSEKVSRPEIINL